MVYLRWLVALLSPALILAPAAAQGRAPVPGEVDAHVTQATIHSTICEHGYTAKVRPPRPFTDAAKRRLADGLHGSPHDYELDHLIPLGLGGHATSANNLWLQNWPEAAIKDRDELRLHREVCAGRITLEQAQHEMLTDVGAAVMSAQHTTSVEGGLMSGRLRRLRCTVTASQTSPPSPRS